MNASVYCPGIYGIALSGVRLLAESHRGRYVASTALDFIGSFTPPPDCNLPLGDARRVLPKKTIMSNLLTALHHHGAKAVRGHARACWRNEPATDGA